VRRHAPPESPRPKEPPELRAMEDLRERFEKENHPDDLDGPDNDKEEVQ
jgi:hypothetical protein